MKLVFILFLLVTIYTAYRLLTLMKLKITEEERKAFWKMNNYEKLPYVRKRVLVDWFCRLLLIIDIILFIFTVYQLFDGKVTHILGLIAEILFAKPILKKYYIDI